MKIKPKGKVILYYILIFFLLKKERVNFTFIEIIILIKHVLLRVNPELKANILKSHFLELISSQVG